MNTVFRMLFCALGIGVKVRSIVRYLSALVRVVGLMSTVAVAPVRVTMWRHLLMKLTSSRIRNFRMVWYYKRRFRVSVAMAVRSPLVGRRRWLRKLVTNTDRLVLILICPYARLRLKALILTVYWYRVLMVSVRFGPNGVACISCGYSFVRRRLKVKWLDVGTLCSVRLATPKRSCRNSSVLM